MENRNQRVSYQEYIKSEPWKEKKRERLDFAMYCCELCSNPNGLEVHHRSYKNLGDERLNDMIALCETCHGVFHRRLGLHEDGIGQYINIREPLAESLGKALEPLKEAHRDAGPTQGVLTGYSRLDDIVGGLQPGNVTVIAGRPSMGTTAFVLALARNVASHPERSTGVIFVTAEMTEEEITQRLLTSESRVDSVAARTGRLHDEDWPRLARSAERLSTVPIYFHTALRLTISDLSSEARAQCRAYKAGLIIIDSLQAIEVPDLARQWREAQVNEIMRVLKGLAINLAVPVIVTSRLNRSVETRGGNKRPQLSDLGEDSIASEADNIFFVYRAERYGITVDEHGNSTEGLAEVIVAKQRNGPIGAAPLAFVHQFARFENLTTYYSETSENKHQAPTPSSNDAPF